MNNKKLCLIFFTIIFMGGVLIGQDDSMLVDEPIVSIHAEDTHLPTILSILAKQSDYNIVTGPNAVSYTHLTLPTKA